MKFFWCGLILFGCNFLASGQEEIKKIDATYQYVMKNIEKREYLLNEYKINATRFALHQPEYFQYFEKYFYMFDKRPESLKKPIIQAVITRNEKEGTVYYKEFIFDIDGNISFYFEQQMPNGAMTPIKKIKLYIFENKIVKWLQGDVEITDKTEFPSAKSKEVLDNAIKYKEKFDKQFAEISMH